MKDRGIIDRMNLDFTSNAIKVPNFSRTLGWSGRGGVRDPPDEQLIGQDFSEHTITFSTGFCEEPNLSKTICQTASLP